MKTQGHDSHISHYGADAAGKVATDFYPLEKAAKISYRALDLGKIFFTTFPSQLITLSSQIKDLVLVIEATRFFCVSFPVFFPKNGSFFKSRTYVQCCERISITSHLALKTLFGADRVGLIRLGIIGTYAVGNLPIFKWAVEGTACLYNFFGVWDGTASLIKSRSNLEVARNKIEKWDLRQKMVEDYAAGPDRIAIKQKKWNTIKANLEIDRNKALIKIAAKVSKFILVVFATSLAVVNIWTIPCQASVLSLGIISDAIAVGGYYYDQYRLPISLAGK